MRSARSSWLVFVSTSHATSWGYLLEKISSSPTFWSLCSASRAPGDLPKTSYRKVLIGPLMAEVPSIGIPKRKTSKFRGFLEIHLWELAATDCVPKVGNSAKSATSKFLVGTAVPIPANCCAAVFQSFPEIPKRELLSMILPSPENLPT